MIKMKIFRIPIVLSLYRCFPDPDEPRKREMKNTEQGFAIKLYVKFNASTFGNYKKRRKAYDDETLSRA